mgnify:CR=1 FL=1
MDRGDDRLGQRAHARHQVREEAIARTAMRDIGSPAMPGGTPWSSRSSPEQKPRPAPVSTTAHTSLSAATASKASCSGATVSKESALSRSARFSVIWATCGRGRVIST